MPLGRLADRTNRRNLMVIAIAGWSLSTVFCGLASNFWELFIARMVLGLGEACLAPAAFSMLVDYFPPSQRGRAITLAQAGTPLGSATAVFGGGLFLSLYASAGLAAFAPAGWAPWKSLFVVSAVPGFLVAAAVALLREPPRHGAAGEPAPPLWPFVRRHGAAFWTMCLVSTLYTAIGYSVVNWTPSVLMRIHHMAPAQAGLASSLILLLCSAPGNVSAGFLSDWLDRRRGAEGRAVAPMLLTPLLVIALAWLALSRGLASSLGALVLTFFLFSIIANTVWPALQAMTPSRLRGQALAIYLLFGNVAGLGLAPTLVGAMNDYLFHDEMMLQVSVGVVNGALAVAALVAAFALPRLYAETRRAIAAEAS